jgi:hypothetical protein
VNPPTLAYAAKRVAGVCWVSFGLSVPPGSSVPAHLLRGALGYDRVLSDADVELLAITAWTILRPAA